MRRLAVLVVLTLLAGCSDDAPAAGPGPTAAPEPAGNSTVDLPIVAAPWDAVLYVDGDALVSQPPAQGGIPMAGLIVPMATGSVGEMQFASAPWPSVSHVAAQTVTVTLVVQTDAAANGNGVFDLAVWFGTTRGESAFLFTTTGPVTPGAPQEVVFELDLEDHPGIVLPAGESYTVRVADSYEPEGLVELLVGPDGSRVEFAVQNLTEDPFAPPQTGTQSFSGQVVGGAFVDCPPAEDVMNFSIGENASWVSVKVEGTSPSPGPVDVDLDVLDGSSLVWHAGSPTAQEEILLAGPALAPYRGQQLEARASICMGGLADYEIAVAQG